MQQRTFDTAWEQCDFADDLVAAGLAADFDEGIDVAGHIQARETRKEREYAAWAAWAGWMHDQRRVERLERRIAQLEARASVASLICA
jgi:hypothetical protein